MHGLYERGVVEVVPTNGPWIQVMAAWNGYRVWDYAGPAMTRFTLTDSPLVSPWNEILSQGLRRDPSDPAPFDEPMWCDRWIAEALLQGRKPFGRFELPFKDARKWCERARQAGLEYSFTRLQPDENGYPRALHISAGRVESYEELFDIRALVADYRSILPPEIVDDEVDALLDHRHETPALYAFVSYDAFARLPRSLRGLTLGYPPTATAGRILLDTHADVLIPDFPIHAQPSKELDPQVSVIPGCDHDHQARSQVSHDELVKACEPLVEFVDYYWRMEAALNRFTSRISGAYLADYPEALVAAFESHVRATSEDRYPRSEAVYAQLCCTLRYLGRDPSRLLHSLITPPLPAWLDRARLDRLPGRRREA